MPATPATLDNLQGGSPGAPVILPSGGVGKITGNIAGPYSAESFYGFTWGGDWKNSKDYQHFSKELD